MLFTASLPVKSAVAVGLDLKKIKPLTEIDFPPEEEFHEKTQLIEEVPYNDESLSFKVRLPKEWQSSADLTGSTTAQGNLGQQALGVLVKYISPPKDHLRSFFTMEALQLTYEIGARNWFINYVISNGLTIEQVGTESERQVEAIYFEVQGDTTYVVRVKAIINGSRMVMARYYLPQEHYQDDWILQGQVIDSFELMNREETGVEELKIHGFLDQSFFDYPVSWTLSAPLVKSIDRMKAMLYHNTVVGKLDGQINIYLTNKQIGTTRAKEVAFYKEKFKIDNYELGKFLDEPKLEFHKDMAFGVTQVYEMNPQVANMMKYELWVSVMEGLDYIYVISLLTPARTEEFYTWARNVEAYKLIIKGMRRNDENVDYYQFIR